MNEDNKVDQTFIIGKSPDRENINFTCDPDKLANGFGANPDAPDYLTLVYFHRDVLGKYYLDPDKYIVQDSELRYGYTIHFF